MCELLYLTTKYESHPSTEEHVNTETEQEKKIRKKVIFDKGLI